MCNFLIAGVGNWGGHGGEAIRQRVQDCVQWVKGGSGAVGCIRHRCWLGWRAMMLAVLKIVTGLPHQAVPMITPRAPDAPTLGRRSQNGTLLPFATDSTHAHCTMHDAS